MNLKAIIELLKWRIILSVLLLILPGVSPAEFNIKGDDVLWQYAYEADKLPPASDPSFGPNSYPGKGTLKAENGVLTLTTAGDGKANQAGFLNMDSPSWTNAPASTIEMRLCVTEQIPGTQFVADLRARANEAAFGIYFSKDKVVLGGQDKPGNDSFALDAKEFHVYRLTLETESVKLYVDGNPKPVLTQKPEKGLPRPLIEFGAFLPSGKFPDEGMGGSVQWDYIRWTQAGAFAPGTKAPEALTPVATSGDKKGQTDKMEIELTKISDPQERAKATVETARALCERGNAIYAVQLLRGIQAYVPDYPSALDMLGYERLDNRWVPKQAIKLFKEGQIKSILSVMTFNLLRDLRNDPKWIWEKRQHLVAEIIRDYRPDLIGIQEVIDPMITPLMTELSDYTLIKMPCDQKLRQGTYGGEFIYRTDRFEALDKQYYIFPPYDAVTGEIQEGATKIVRRGGTMVKLRDKVSGKTVCAFSSHVAHESREMNLASCELIKKRLLELPPDALVFVMGDFNISRDTPSWNVLTTGERALSDPKALAIQKCISGNKNDRIDWLCFYPADLPALFYAVIQYKDGDIRASDHDTVFAQFGLK